MLTFVDMGDPTRQVVRMVEAGVELEGIADGELVKLERQPEWVRRG